MKEATFNAEDLGLVGEITAVQFDSDNTVTVKYADTWKELMDYIERNCLTGSEIVSYNRSCGYIDIIFEETDFKICGVELPHNYTISSIAHFKDDELTGILRVWFKRDK